MECARHVVIVCGAQDTPPFPLALLFWRAFRAALVVSNVHGWTMCIVCGTRMRHPSFMHHAIYDP